MSATDPRGLYERWFLELWHGEESVAYAGGFPGATAPEGTEVAFGGIDIMRVADGRLAEYWVSSDGIALMQQLGALG